MKVLLDNCVWGGVRPRLEAAGHDVLTAADCWDEDPGDEEILERAHREARLLITLDKDFGELAIAQGKPHSGILRLVNVSALRQAPICIHVLALHADDLTAGAIVTAEPGRLRIRLPA